MHTMEKTMQISSKTKSFGDAPQIKVKISDVAAFHDNTYKLNAYFLMRFRPQYRTSTLKRLLNDGKRCFVFALAENAVENGVL